MMITKYVGSNNVVGDVCHFQGQYMEGRHCLSAASVIAGLAGEIPSEEAAQESEYPSKIFSLSFPFFVIFGLTPFCLTS